MATDINNFYLNTPLDRFKYMRLDIALLPDEIIRQYHLLDIAQDGYMYLELRKGMCTRHIRPTSGRHPV
jgi:hypothetical protein